MKPLARLPKNTAPSSLASLIEAKPKELSFEVNISNLADLAEFLRTQVKVCCQDSTNLQTNTRAQLKNQEVKNPKNEARALILLELAVTEVVVNAFKHGNATLCYVSVDKVGVDKVSVNKDVDKVSELNDRNKSSEGVNVTIKDNGLLFDLSKVVPKPMGELREHGYGVGIIHKAVTGLSYAQSEGWNLLSLRFACV